MDFDDVTRWPGGEGTFPASWAQGRAAFGGAVAAVCVRASDALVDASARQPVSIDCAFLGPVLPEQPARVEARLLRSGKSVTTIEATLVQAGQPCARTLVTYALPRASRIAFDLPQRALPPYDPAPVPMVEGVTPAFVQHFDLTWAVGAYPFLGVRDPVLGGFCRHRTHATGTPALLALIDAWPAPILPVLTGPAPASSVRWTAHLTAPERFDPTGVCFFEARVAAARDGYATTLGHLYDATGAPIAWTEQLVAYFER